VLNDAQMRFFCFNNIKTRHLQNRALKKVSYHISSLI